MLQPLWNYIVSRFVMDLWLWYNVTPHISNYYCTILMVFFLLLQVLSMSRRGCPLIAVLKMHSTWQGLQGFLQTGLTRQGGHPVLFVLSKSFGSDFGMTGRCSHLLATSIIHFMWRGLSTPLRHVSCPFWHDERVLHLSATSIIHVSVHLHQCPHFFFKFTVNLHTF